MRQKYGLIIGIIFLIGYVWPQPALAQEPGPVVLEATAQGLSLTWTPPAYSLTTVEFEGQVYSQLRLPDLISAGQPGSPELPLYSGLIGLPPTGGAHLHLSEVEREVVALPHPVWPASTPQPVFFANSSVPPVGGSTTHRPDPTLYATNSFYPPHIAELGPVEQMRDHRLARLVIHPLRVNPASGQMEVIRRLRLEITFDQPGPALNGLAAQARPNPFDRALAATLINPQASQWTISRPTPGLSATSVGALAETDLFKITVNTPGLYVLTYNDLLTAGLPVATLDPRTLQVSHGWPRQEVAIWIEGENDGAFNPGDRLLFYAEPAFSRFVDYDVYFLSYGQGTGRRMDSRSANPTGLPPGVAWRTAVAETNQFYEPYYPGRDGDYWYWDNLRRPDIAAATYALPVEAPLTSGPVATLTLWLQSYTDPVQNPDHRLAVSLNSTALGEHTWNGSQALTVTLTAPSGLLVNGTNQIGLSLPGLSGVTVEGTWFDALSLTYPTGQAGAGQLIFQGQAGTKAYTLTQWSEANFHVYDITDPANPHRLSDYVVTPQGANYSLTLGDAGPDAARYLVAPNSRLKSPQAITPAAILSDPPEGADYIIITHANFAAAVAPLAAHRAGQGLRMATIDVQAIYDTFGEGRMDPAAIKNFLSHAYTTWPSPAPAYVLLVGDGSYDFKNYSGYNPSTFIPPYLAHVDPWWGETASDHQFVTLSGADPLPELSIGRLAVNTPAQAATVVDKIIHYETNPTPGEWNARQLFVADNDEPAYNLYFHADSDQGYSQVNPPFVGQRFYYSDRAGNPTYIYTDPNTLRSALLNSINYGANLITFNGHSSWLQWAVEGILRYYPPPYTGPNDLTSLHNQYRLPIVLEMTCFTGSFHRPEVATLDESLLNLAGGGAVAVWGSTGLGVSTGHVSLQHGFYQAAYTQGKTQLGAATLAGQMELYATGLHQDLLDTFMLFGDPALAINLTIIPLPNRVYLPIVFR
ncbi:MAG: hypothetical protein JXM69_18410 [Anaerolineae bacterium]|nr:hypothetical protein [Anaerolineae bacterium]